MIDTGVNPVLVEIARGDAVESRHRGAVAIANASGEIVLALGDIDTPIFPRSAVKAMQTIPLVESGAAAVFGLNDQELAVACGSHSGDDIHVETVRSLLAKAGVDESQLACGPHWPMSEKAARELIRADRRALPIHNNCSGKHAGMLAAARFLGLETVGYEQPEHPLQVMIARIISDISGIELAQCPMGMDGCSVPTWALPLRALATGFARFGSAGWLPPDRQAAAERLLKACFNAPVLVAGQGRLDTIVLTSLAPFVFSKGGAEGVHCAALPDQGLGIAIKIDDGSKRATDRVLAELLAVMAPPAGSILTCQLSGAIRNWRGVQVGQISASAGLQGALSGL